MNIEHISVSRYGVFTTCAEQYRFRYHLRIPPPGPEPIYFAYGKLVHRIAELYVRRGDPASFHEIVADVMQGRIEIQEGQRAPILDKDYARKIGPHLKNLKQFADRVGLDQEGMVEHKFEYDLMPPRGYYVTGFIDRIVVKGDNYFVIDYKTTKKGPWLKDRHSILTDLQLRIYARVVQKEFGAKAENIHCCLYYLDAGSVVGATFSQKSLDDAEKELLDAYVQIHEMDPAKVYGTVGPHCRRCDFKSMCRFWSLVDD